MVIMLNERSAKGNAKKIIIDAHSKCSGISSTILNYLKLNDETPTIEELQKQPFFSRSVTEITQAYDATDSKTKLMIETVFEKMTSFVLFTSLMLRNSVLPNTNGGTFRRKKRKLTRKLKY